MGITKDATKDWAAMRGLEGWHGTEQLVVGSLGDTNYVIGYDMTGAHGVLGGNAVLEAREGREVLDTLIVPDDAMDFMARWWLEKRGWRVSAPPTEPQPAPPAPQPEAPSERRQDSSQGKARR